MVIDEIVDVHTHTFKSADTGINWQKSIGNSNPERTGAIDELLGLMGQAGIGKAIMLMYIPSQYMYEVRVSRLNTEGFERHEALQALKTQIIQRVVNNNDWGCQVAQEHPNLIPFLHLDPVLMSSQEMIDEIHDKTKRGSKGVKIVPLNLKMYGDDPRLWPIYEECHKHKLTLLTQAGGRPERDSGPSGPWGRPMPFQKAAREFPDMKIILAHIGRGFEEEVAALTGNYENIFTDLSSRLHLFGQPGEWNSEEAVGWIRRIGVDHVLFGTNYPGGNPIEYVKAMDSLKLKDDEKSKILSGNAKRVIGL